MDLVWVLPSLLLLESVLQNRRLTQILIVQIHISLDKCSIKYFRGGTEAPPRQYGVVLGANLDVTTDYVTIQILNLAANASEYCVLNRVLLWLVLTMHNDVALDANNPVIGEC